MKEALPIPADLPGIAFLQCLPGYLHPRHRHDELELNLVLRGNAVYQIGSRLYRIERGSMAWLFPGQDHHVIAKSEDYTVWIVYWRAALVHTVLAGDPGLAVLGSNDPSGWFCRRLGEPQLRRLDHLLREIESATLRPLVLQGLGYALLLAWTLFSGGQDEAPAADLHPAVSRAGHLLAAPRELSLRVLARTCGLSPARLSLLFSQQMGMPLTTYRNQRRIERFLVEHDPRTGNLLASALAVGFGSYSQFHRQFTRLMGLSPRRWEQRARQERLTTIDRRTRGQRV